MKANFEGMSEHKEMVDPDHGLLTRLRNGDHASFSELYATYSDKVYAFILKYIHSSELSKDLTQEVFIKIWEGRENLEGIRSLRAFIFKVARNHTFNTLKRIAIEEAAQSHLLSHFEREQQVVEDDFVYREYLELLNQEVERLPERTREIFKMCRQRGKSYEEAAAALGISRTAIKQHMVFSMKVLGDFAKKDLGLSLSILLGILCNYFTLQA